MKSVKNIIWWGILVLLLLPIIQQVHPIIQVQNLSGAFHKKDKPNFSSEQWFNSNFQNQTQGYLKENYSFGKFLIRINNQLEYDIYGKINASEIFEGKDNYLFRFHTPLYQRHTLFRGEEALEEKIEKLEQISRYLDSEFGTKIITVIPPAKHYFHDAYLPDLNRGPDTLNNNYKVITRELSKRALPFIDFNKHYLSIKDSLDFPLYAKSGIHWTMLGAFHSMDSVIRYMEDIGQEDLANITFTKPEVREPWIPDQDIYHSLNLIGEWEDLDLQYADLIPDSTGRKPRVITIADSYYHAVTWPMIPQTYFDSLSVFWYYNKTYFNTKNEVLVAKNFKQNLQEADYVLILFTPINFEDFGAGFIEEAHSNFIQKDGQPQ